MNDRHFSEHPGAETLEAFLDGALPSGERGRIEEHLASCARCAAELDGWRLLFDDLRDLPTLAPRAGFSDRVLAGVEVAGPLPLAARVAARVRAALGHEHPESGRLQDWVEGLVPEAQAARIRTHVEGCAICGSQAASWRTLLGALDGLDRFAPAQDFAARVMAGVRVPVPATRRAPEWRRALARVADGARRLVPRTRKTWATVSGVALTPAVTLGLLVWTVFAHPTVTPSALVSFAWWKVSDLAALVWQAASARVMESVEVFGVFSLVRSLALTPTVLVSVFLALSAGTVWAAWVLYRNLYTHPSDGGYAHVSLP